MAKTSYQKQESLSISDSGEKTETGSSFLAERKDGYSVYQTIIIGASFGGLTAGRYLKDAVILDRKKELGLSVKTGEGVSKLALERVGLKPDSSWISSEIRVMQRIVPSGKVIGQARTDLGYILNTGAFEKFLAEKCQAEIELDVEVINIVQENNLWKVTAKDGRVFKAKFLIGADGALSVARREIFGDKLEVLPAMQYLAEFEKEIDCSIAKIYLDNEKFSDGYAWVFPKSKNTANIGIGGKGNHLSEKFQNFLENIAEKDLGEIKILENRSGAIPFGGAQLKISKDNVLLVGDAAGLADPIFLGGISQAMLSGKIAAECILNNEVSLYEKKIKAMPFADSALLKARKIFYSFNNKVLNELGDILEDRGSSYLKTFPGILKILSKPSARKNFFKLIVFFRIWRRNRDYLW